MNRKEISNVFETLKNSEKSEKGFSLGRTLKRLKKYNEQKTINDYIKELKKSGGIKNDTYKF